MSATVTTLGRCVSCTAGKHDECDAGGASWRCVCCPNATHRSPARRMSDALRGELIEATTNKQGADDMTTTNDKQKPEAEKAAQVQKRAARPNVAAKKAAVKKAAAPKDEAPKADAKPKVEKFDKCPLCGYVFSDKQGPAPKCKNPVACQRRRDGKPQRGTGGTGATTSNDNGAHAKAERITALNAERQSVKDWKAGGEQGDRPATPLLDKLEADYAAKEAAKAAAAAERSEAKAAKAAKEVTPILKSVK